LVLMVFAYYFGSKTVKEKEWKILL
jgi:hypothetical protein